MRSKIPDSSAHSIVQEIIGFPPIGFTFFPCNPLEPFRAGIRQSEEEIDFGDFLSLNIELH
jgi:hypothetical protein